MYTYPEDCSCLNSQDNQNRKFTIGSEEKDYASLLSTFGGYKDTETIQPSTDPEAHPLKTDQFCKDRSTLNYKLVNSRTSEYSQPAYVLSTDRETYNLPVDYSLPSTTTGEPTETTENEDEDEDEDEEDDEEDEDDEDETKETVYVDSRPTQSSNNGDDEEEDSFLTKYMWWIVGAVVLLIVLIAIFMMQNKKSGNNFYY